MKTPMLKKDAWACWEYWKCPEEEKKNCPVYSIAEGRKCWIYTHELTPFKWAKTARPFKTCLECPWYKKIQAEQAAK